MSTEISRESGHSFQQQNDIPLLQDAAFTIHGVQQSGQLSHRYAQLSGKGFSILDAAGAEKGPIPQGL